MALKGVLLPGGHSGQDVGGGSGRLTRDVHEDLLASAPIAVKSDCSASLNLVLSYNRSPTRSSHWIEHMQRWVLALASAAEDEQPWTYMLD